MSKKPWGFTDTNQEPLREIRYSRAIFTCRPCRKFTWVLYIQQPNLLFNLHKEQAGSFACSPSVDEAAHFSLSETPPTNTSLGLLSSSVQTRGPRAVRGLVLSARPALSLPSPHTPHRSHTKFPPLPHCTRHWSPRPCMCHLPTQNALMHPTSAHIIPIWPLVFALILWSGELLVIPLPSI